MVACLSHLVLNAQLVPADPTTVVFTDNDSQVTVTIPASALIYQKSRDMEGKCLMHTHNSRSTYMFIRIHAYICIIFCV